MEESLNLMAHRGRASMWPRMESEQVADAMVALAVGAIAIAASVRGRPTRATAAAAGLMCVGSAYLFGSALDRAVRLFSELPGTSRRQREDAVDQMVEDSFPASDPPSSMQAQQVPAVRR